MAKKREDYLINLVVTSENLAGGDLDELSKEVGKLNREITNLGKAEEERAEQLAKEGKETTGLTKENKHAIESSKDLAKATKEETEARKQRNEEIEKSSTLTRIFSENVDNALKKITSGSKKTDLNIDTTEIENQIVTINRALNNLDIIKQRLESEYGPSGAEDEIEKVEKVERRLLSIRKQLRQEAQELGVSSKSLKNAEALAKSQDDLNKSRAKAEKEARSMARLQEQAIAMDKKISSIKKERLKAELQLYDLLEKEKELTDAAAKGGDKERTAFEKWEEDIKATKREILSLGGTLERISEIEAEGARVTEEYEKRAKKRSEAAKKGHRTRLENLKKQNEEEHKLGLQQSAAEKFDEARTKRQQKSAQIMGQTQARASRMDDERGKKRADAQAKFVKLLEKEEAVRNRAERGDEVGRAELEKWAEDVEAARRAMIEFGISEEETYLIQNRAARSASDRLLKVTDARLKYAKAVEKENKILNENVELTSVQEEELKYLEARKNELRKTLAVLGAQYSDLDKKQKSSTESTKENARGLSALRNVINSFKGDDRDRNPFLGFVAAFRNTSQEAAVLSRKLGRLGLAVRGLVIVGVLAFMQSFISVVGALGAQLVALVGSILSAASAIAVTFISAVAQAIPVVGLLAASFNRLTAIQEAVKQADLAKKNAFGDTGAEKAATDAALQIADAQTRVKEAQEEVTKARKEAKKELEDLILKEKEAELALKGAVLSQLEARRALRETIGAGDVESVARDQLGIEESSLGTVRARRELREARQARRQGLRGGPEGTETYKNAVKALTDAQKALAQAQRSGADSADTQSAAQRNLAFFLSQLSEAERKLFKQFTKAKQRYEKVFRPITDIIINAFSRAFTRVEKLLFSGEIVNGFRSLAQVVGGSFDKLSKTLTSPVFKEFFVEMIRQASSNMPLLTDALILLADIFRNIALAAGPVFRALLEFIVEKLDQFNTKVSETGALTEFLMMGEKHFEAWIELIISILGLMGELMGASANSALETITSLTDTINGAKESLREDDSGARTFFDDAAQSVKEMGRVILELGKTIVALTRSEQVKALADIFTEMLIPGLEKGVKIIGVFALGLDKILENKVAAEMLQLGVATFFVVSAFTAVRAIFQPAITLFIGLGKAVIFANAAVGGWFGVWVKVVGLVDKLSPRLASLIGNTQALKNVFKELGKQIARFFAVFSLFGRSIPQLRGVFVVVDKIGKVFSKLAPIFNKLRPLLALLPKIVGKAFAFLGPVGTAIAIAIELVIGMVTALKENFLGVGDAMSSALGELGEAFSDLFNGDGEGGNFLTFLLDVTKAIFNIINFVGKLVGALLLFGVIEVIIRPLTTIIKLIDNAVDTISGFIGLLRKGKIGKAFELLAKGVGKGLGMALGFIWRAIIIIPKLILQLIGKIIPLVLKLVWSAFKAFGKLIWNFGKTIFNAFIETFTNPSSWADRFNAVLNVIKNLASSIWNILKGAATGLVEGLVEGLGTDTANWVVNGIIDIINGIIKAYNALPFVPDIGELDDVDIKLAEPPENNKNSGGRGRARDIDADTESQNKNNKSKKDATKFNLGNYKALNLAGGASKRNTKLNNQLADSLGRSSKQHKRAQNLQEALAKASARGRKQQELYANAVRQTAKVEERYANSLARGRRIKGETNEKDRASVKIRENLTEATKKVSRVQGRYYNSTVKSAAASQIFNRNIKTGNNLQEKYSKHLKKSSDASDEQRKATARLSRRLGSLNKVLQITGENSRALGSVFKTVTNRILTEFNVRPLKLQLPSVSGMFRQAMGGNSQNFQRGGYFGNKGMRGPDDRTIMVAGGEAILTGNHQAAVDTAFGIANQTAGFPYESLDSMFNKDKRPHASAKRYNRGGKIPGYATGGNVLIPTNIPDAQGALPGLDLMGLILSKYFGLSVTSGLYGREGDLGSDHSWGGAIDVSNGSSPTPQMDSAWFWLTRTLGGAKAGGFIENYASGAIKQMLYRTNIGGNHFDHIHLALLESYARNASAVAAILEGKAVPNANGAMFIEAPKLKKPKIKGDNGAPKNMLQGQSDMLTEAANKILKKKIQPLSGNISLASMGNFNAINRIYPEQNSALGQWGGTVLPFNVVAALAQAAGMPGVTFAQIAKGESGLRPGATGIDPGGTKGLGLWMITTGYNDDLIAQFGGQAQMRNPVKNAMAAKKIYDSQGVGAWYGTGFVTDFNKPYRGQIPEFPHNRGGMIPEFNDGGVVPGPLGMPVLVKAHAGETILPTHKYQSGGMVPRYQTGGRYDGIPSNTTIADVRNVKPSRLQNQITALTKRLQKAETEQRKNFLQERIAELKDQLLLSKEVKAYNKEIKNINKDINKKKKEIRNADEEDKKELEKELKELQRDLAAKKKDKRATVAFEGELYNTSIVNEFILLISDRINSFMKKLESEVSKMAIATAKWTYKIVKVDGKKIISRVNSAVDEATRGLQDLVAETGLIVNALAETNRAEKRARARLKKVRDNYTKKINKAQKALDRAKKIQDEEEREKAVKAAKKELEELRKSKKEDIQKLQTSIKNSNNKQKELQERLNENLAARYEQQIAIFEEGQAALESELSAFDTQIEIASLQFADNEGNLSEEGKGVVKGFYEQRARTLEQQRAKIQEELNAARAAKDIERSRELEQALLENQLALLQNTKSIEELDESVQEGLFDFTSTNWEQFRQAIFSNGSILPQFQSQIPQLATGGYVTREGLAYLHAAEVVVPASKTGNAGPLVDTINFTQPMETADPVAISNQIGFKLSTLKSL